MKKVLIPSALRSYTGQTWVTAEGATLAELLLDLDRQYPGFRFRMVDEQDRLRSHMRVFIDGHAVHDLARPLAGVEAVHIVQALSGG